MAVNEQPQKPSDNHNELNERQEQKVEKPARENAINSKDNLHRSQKMQRANNKDSPSEMELKALNPSDPKRAQIEDNRFELVDKSKPRSPEQLTESHQPARTFDRNPNTSERIREVPKQQSRTVSDPISKRFAIYIQRISLKSLTGRLIQTTIQRSIDSVWPYAATFYGDANQGERIDI